MTPFKDDDFIIAIKEIEKLVAELEALQDIILEKDEALEIERLLFKKKLQALENRSCERCKYSFDIFTGIDDSLLGEDFICTKLKVDKVFNKDFYCSEWESKC
jgi:chromosome condensin MukBEF complex kleisin-like MukF subunit